MVNYEGNETILLTDARSRVNTDGYVLANTDGDDHEHEADDEDEEQRLVQSEMDGMPRAPYRTHDLSEKAGIILVCLSGPFAINTV